MIVRVTDDTARLGIRLTDWRHNAYLADWKRVRLVLLAGQRDNPCGPNGSPWFLHGCWPCLPTGVDLANPPMPDFPAISIEAVGAGDGCELTFLLPERFKELPHGRYTGLLMHSPAKEADPCADEEDAPSPASDPLEEILLKMPWIYRSAPCSTPYVCCPPPKVPAPKACVFAEFDIDYGPRCGDLVIDRVSAACRKEWCDADGC